MVLGIAWLNQTIYDLGMIIVAIPPLFIYGRKNYTTAFKAVRHGSANMDVLITMGTEAAFITGPFVFFTPMANYVGVAGLIIAFHFTGKLKNLEKGKVLDCENDIARIKIIKHSICGKCDTGCPF